MAHLNQKFDKRGEFLACSGWPDCKNAKNFDRDAKGGIGVKEREPETPEVVGTCPDCGKDLYLRKARTGARPEDVKAMEATIAGLAAKVSQARSSLEDTELRAPFDGFIADRHVENFQSVQRDQPIVNLQDLAHLEVTVAVPEQDLLLFMGVSRDMVARAFSEVTGSKEIPLTFKEIATQAESQTQTYAATFQIVSREGINLLPGMTLSVRIGGRARGAELSGPFRVPSEAVMAGEGTRHSVWVVQENLSVRRVTVALLSFREGDALISGDLKAGDRVVTAGANLLLDGETVSLYTPK